MNLILLKLHLYRITSHHRRRLWGELGGKELGHGPSSSTHSERHTETYSTVCVKD